MKRVVLIGFILAILILAMPQGVSAAFNDADEVTIDADYYTATDFSATRIGGEGWNWPLQVSEYDNLNYKADAIDIYLLTQADWTITAADTTDGQVEWGYLLGTANDASHNLQNPFRVGRKDNVMVTLTASPPPVMATGNALNSDQGWNAAIDQKVVADDYGSPGGWSAQITFTCTADF